MSGYLTLAGDTAIEFTLWCLHKGGQRQQHLRSLETDSTGEPGQLLWLPSWCWLG